MGVVGKEGEVVGVGEDWGRFGERVEGNRDSSRWGV